MSLEALDLEDVRDNEVLVRLVATGVCHTDLAMRDQAFPVPQPIVLGTEVSLDVMDIMTQGKKLRGIVEGDSIPDVFIPQMIELHRQGRFPFDKLIAFYPFDRINDAINDSETGKVVKPVVRMPG